MRLTRSLSAVAAAAAVALFAAGCTAPGEAAAPADTAGQDAAQETQTVRVGLQMNPHLFHPAFFADFAPEGVDVEVILFATSPDVRNALVTGDIDFGMSGLSAAISSISAGQDLAVVAAAADGGSGIIGRPGLEGLESLRGLTVGFPQGAVQEIQFHMTAAAAGMDANTDFDLVPLPFAEMASALASGRIDAFISSEVGVANALLDGGVHVASPYETPLGKANIVLLARGGLVTSDPDLVQAIVDTHVQVTELMLNEPEVWAERFVEESGASPEVTAKAITNIWPRWSFDAQYLGEVEALLEQMLIHEQIENSLTLDQVVITDFVDAVASRS